MSGEATKSIDMVWWGWGTAEDHEPLSESTASLLHQAFGIGDSPTPPGPMPVPPPSRLGDQHRTHLTRLLGAGGLSVDDTVRVLHTRGKSTPDLIRARTGDASGAPDAVAYPSSHETVLELLDYCSTERIAVVPFGGGTAVTGGLEPEAAGFVATLALDLRRMNALVAVDRESMTATLQPGLRGPEAERLLGEQGLTLGHFPQSFMHASIGGFAATRSSGQASSGYGRFDAMVVGLTVATPTGSWTLGRGPANAAGPDLRQVVLGSEGAFGVITEVIVAVHDAPIERRYEGWQVDSFAAGLELMRGLARSGTRPVIARLSDEVETAVGLANAKSTGEQTTDGGCYVMVGFEGTPAQVGRQQAAALEVLDIAGARQLGGELGDAWLEGRFHGPYLRDALLDAGGFAETLETTTDWSKLPGLYAAVREAAVGALQAAGTPPIVLCHVSHTYRTGASLYFTIVCKQADDPIAQWDAAKHAISDAIMAAGGSITHHHAVGTDHRPWLEQEIGEAGVRVLAAIKRELDPAGILNPGVLVAREATGL